jgi:hypothetical protein
LRLALKTTYESRLKAHLVRFKEEALNISESGTWRRKGKETVVPHILPPELAHRNLLPLYQDECWTYMNHPATKVKDHMYFHHLNSSQAMCLNLFFPFVADGGRLLPVLLEMLDLPQAPAHPHFEKVFDANENTNFDFYLEDNGGVPLAFFEVKLSEEGFGGANSKDVEKYRRKLDEYHQEHLSKYIKPKWLELDAFMVRYQVLRNLSYACKHAGSTLFFVVPKANEKLTEPLAELRDICPSELMDRVRVVYIEDFVEDILASSEVRKDRKLLTHFQEFKAKYVI